MSTSLFLFVVIAIIMASISKVIQAFKGSSNTYLPGRIDANEIYDGPLAVVTVRPDMCGDARR